ncbi:Conserved_hypothetical protein [Hexamita inflata]|uniref:Uncharacterized protein n=1 Tax=Hexamita inflata TaxID=28002 RepID=A0AA86RPN7_9EUKA|nr:Conserved hypothetical protein [Hexamita inflata]
MKTIVILDIETNDGQTQQLEVFEGISAQRLAENFVEEYQLEKSTIKPLAKYIESEISNYEENLQTIQFQPKDSHIQPSLKYQQEQIDRLSKSRRQQLQQKQKQQLVIQTNKNVQIEYPALEPIRLSVHSNNEINSGFESSEDVQVQSPSRHKKSKVFESLYNDSKRRVQKQQLLSPVRKPQFTKIKLPSKNDDMYNRNLKWLSTSRSKIEKLQKEKELIQKQKEIENLKECTFEPQITEYAKQMVQNPENVFERQHMNVLKYSQNKMKFDETQKQKDDRFDFKPKLSYTQQQVEFYERLKLTMGPVEERVVLRKEDHGYGVVLVHERK